MTKDELCEALNYVNASRRKRYKMAGTIEENLHLIPLLIEIIKDDIDPISSKASWVLEYVAHKDLRPIFTNIDLFINSLQTITLESSVRPVSKICQFLVLSECSRKNPKKEKILTEQHLCAITESAFDWLIGEHKVAPKAYSMTTLLHIGNHIPWIHPELQLILQQNYEKGSAAYKARARMTLKILEKKYSSKS